MTNMTPIDRAALALVPLMIEARELFAGTGLRADGYANNAICEAFSALTQAAADVSYRLLRKSSWRGGDESHALMVKIDDALAEIQAIERGEP